MSHRPAHDSTITLSEKTSQTDDQRIRDVTPLPPPAHPIRFFPIVGTSVETPIKDAWLLAPALNESMSANVVVDNVPGAGGTIGVDRVAKLAPDGHTLLLPGDAALVLTGGAHGMKPPYETLRDFAAIAQLFITPNGLVVANDAPARNVTELVALVAASWASSAIRRRASACRNIAPAS